MNIEVYVIECKNRIEQGLRGYLKKNSYEVNQATRDMVLKPSHRWRPIIMITSAEMYDPNAFDKVKSHALAAELLHKASLIFDDLPSMDDAEKRSGYLACHKKYGEANAILAGLNLIFNAYLLCATNTQIPVEKRSESIQIISEVGIDATLGQEMDLKSQELSLDQKLLTYINESKTAKLFASSAKIGGLLLNAPLKEQEFLYDFGLNLGISYQYWDDKREIINKEPSTSKVNPNAVKIIGMKKTEELLEKHKSLAMQFLEPFGRRSNSLRELTEYMFQQK